MMFDLTNAKVGVIGLGYVGLPLAVEFGKQRKTIGFDINQARIDELSAGRDSTLECSDSELAEATQLIYTTSIDALRECNVYIVTVPTPVDEHKKPDLTPLIKASESLGKIVSLGDIVIYESTVYPGATEEDCIPVIERISGLKFNEDFFAGYSPERINPGDKVHRVTNILKVTSGSTPEVSEFVDELYKSIITAGTYKASSIRVAEASKVIENTQRDVNIALINELSMVFNKLDIDTLEVLEAAGTKWNFLPFRPGLVGGHCIGVDPYYLTHKSQASGFIPDMIIAARRINDGMADFIVSQLIRKMIKKKIHVEESKILIMGFSFKENCPDLRNTKVNDIINQLGQYNADIDIYDPWCNKEEASNEYGVCLIDSPMVGAYDAIIIAVSHDVFKAMGSEEISKFCKNQSVIYDLKHILPKDVVDIRL